MERRSSGSMWYADPNEVARLEAALAEALRAGDAASVHRLADRVLTMTLENVADGEKEQVASLARLAARVADPLEAPELPEIELARYHLVLLPWGMEAAKSVVARVAGRSAATSPGELGEAAREVLGVLAAAEDFLRRGEVHARGTFTVKERQVGNLLEQLREGGLVCRVTRNTPGPAAHYALTPEGRAHVEERPSARRDGAWFARAAPTAAAPREESPAEPDDEPDGHRKRSTPLPLFGAVGGDTGGSARLGGAWANAAAGGSLAASAAARRSTHPGRPWAARR